MKRMTMLAAAAAAVAMMPAAASAQIEQYMGDVILVGYNFCPLGWAEANGQLLAVAEYDALYSLIGTTYGGDGSTTFAVPDLRGRIPVGVGPGPGMNPIIIGETFGTPSVTLIQPNLAAHTHAVHGTSQIADTVSPENATPATFNQPRYRQNGVDVTMDHDMVASAGGASPVDVHAPTLALRYCIATEGIYPQRN